MDLNRNGKRFTEWIRNKAILDMVGRRPNIRAGEVWWCAVGENIGAEINGKNMNFSRPVLVIKKFGNEEFMGIPLTRQRKGGAWYARFRFQGEISYAALTQARSLSVSRLFERIGEVPESTLEEIRGRFCKICG